MAVLFWFSLAVCLYAYTGYAVLLALYARVRSRPVLKQHRTPHVSVILAVHNEEKNLPRKLTNLFALAYPPGQLQIVIASDGSTDGTNALLQQNAPRVVPVFLPVPAGKASALNRAVEVSTGEILVFMDARQTVNHDAISELVSCFAAAEVGAVSGELHLLTAEGQPSPDALGIYWKIEKIVRKLESATGSVVGVTGALYALRRELYVPLPNGTLLDDVLVPMQAARAGRRILFHETAIAHDILFEQRGKEFARKVRTLTGNYQLLRLAPWLLSFANPLLFRFISHKLLRLVVPLFLVAMLVGSGFAHGPFYKLALFLQLALYLLALLGALLPATRRWRPVAVAFTFIMLNVAAALAFYNFVGGRSRWA